MNVSPFAGKPAEPSMLVNVPRLVTAYYSETPDASVPAKGSPSEPLGHRGSAFDLAFNEWHRALRRRRHGQCFRAAGDEAGSPTGRRVGRLRLQHGCVCGPAISGLHGASDTELRRRCGAPGRSTNPVAAMIRSTEEKTMQKTTAITCLFLDIGGVLLTNGWDHHARETARRRTSSWSWPRWRIGIT